MRVVESKQSIRYVVILSIHDLDGVEVERRQFSARSQGAATKKAGTYCRKVGGLSYGRPCRHFEGRTQFWAVYPYNYQHSNVTDPDDQHPSKTTPEFMLDFHLPWEITTVLETLNRLAELRPEAAPVVESIAADQRQILNRLVEVELFI